MGFRLLGPVEVWTGSGQVVAGPPRQSLLVVALAVDAGRVVPLDVLMYRIWGQDPPERARRTLHAYIARARRTVQSVADGDDPAQLVRRAGGYLLCVDPDQVDLHRFRRLLEQARDPACSDEQRVGQLREAIRLWRGEPLAGLAGEWVERTRQSWRQQHLDAVVAWARAELRVDNPAAAVEPLTELADEHPLVEPLTAVLMRALTAVGRPADALDRYIGTRRQLADELGADPGPELQAVHQAILRGQINPPATSAVAPAGPAPARRAGDAPAFTTRRSELAELVPAQLPADVVGFTGRAEQLARLDALLDAADKPPTPMLITAVSGTPGVGKTALAVHWAHRVREKFPDGQLYANLRGFDPAGQAVGPAEVIRGFLDALGVHPEHVPTSLDAQAGLYRSALDDKRMLVVLDNVRDADQARPLLPGTPTAVVVVTSRNQLTALVAADGAYPLFLDLLTQHEARELLAHRLGPGRVAAESAAAEEIITACARLPLALTIAAARAAVHPTHTLAALAAELADAGGRLDTLDAGDPATQVRAVFSWSYAVLSPDAARLFRLLGLHPGPDISAAAAASLTAHTLSEIRPLLAALTRASLLTEHTPGRYTFHDLLRAYATDLTNDIDSPDERSAAITRLLGHYTHTACAAARLVEPVRDPMRLPLTPPAPGTTPERLDSQQQATAWLDAEHPTLLAAVRLAADHGRGAQAWHLAWALTTFLNQRGRWSERAGAWQAALPAAACLNHPTAAGFAHRSLAGALVQLGRHGDAHSHYEHALELYARAGDRVGQAHTHLGLASHWERQGRPERALQHSQHALTLHQATGHRRGLANSLNSIGWYQAMLGEHTQALTQCRRALTLFQQLGDREGTAATWDSLGYVHRHLVHLEQAADCYDHACALYRALGDRYREATTLANLGDTRNAAGDADAARTLWVHALDILTDIHHPDAYTVHTKLRHLR